jgi:hypothetical protein
MLNPFYTQENLEQYFRTHPRKGIIVPEQLEYGIKQHDFIQNKLDDLVQLTLSGKERTFHGCAGGWTYEKTVITLKCGVIICLNKGHDFNYRKSWGVNSLSVLAGQHTRAHYILSPEEILMFDPERIPKEAAKEAPKEV